MSREEEAVASRVARIERSWDTETPVSAFFSTALTDTERTWLALAGELARRRAGRLPPYCACCGCIKKYCICACCCQVKPGK